MEVFLMREWDLNLPVSGASSTLAGGTTLAARWLHEPQPISNQPVWLGFPHRAGQNRPGGSPFFVPRLLELVVEILKDSSSWDKTLSSPLVARHRRWPEGQLPPRAGYMSLS